MVTILPSPHVHVIIVSLYHLLYRPLPVDIKSARSAHYYIAGRENCVMCTDLPVIAANSVSGP